MPLIFTPTKAEAIDTADAWTNDSGLPTYSELVAFAQHMKTVGMLASCSSHVVPEYAKEASALLDRINA